jgi:hypothetical protein
MSRQVEAGGAQSPTTTLGASVDADLDLLLIAVFCTADDLLPTRAGNAKRILPGISSDEKFWATVPRRLGHLFPRLIERPGFVKRRQRLSDTIEALIVEFARHSHLAPIRQYVESIFWTAKDMLGLEDHGARELHTLRARLASKFLALTAAIALNHRLGRAPRNLTAYYA